MKVLRVIAFIFISGLIKIFVNDLPHIIVLFCPTKVNLLASSYVHIFIVWGSIYIRCSLFIKRHMKPLCFIFFSSLLELSPIEPVTFLSSWCSIIILLLFVIVGD